MTDHIDVPVVATGDWIDAAFINQYWGDNFRALYQGYANVGSLAYALDSNTIAELVKPAVDSFLKNTSAGALSWVSFDKIWPVGSVYISVVATNPNTLLGFGTWTAFATGRTLVGLDAGQTEFDSVEETGGEKTHALTSAENGAHTHTQSVRGLTSQYGGTGGPYIFPEMGLLAAATNTGSSGSGTGHNNLQPYIVVYMWKRTA